MTENLQSAIKEICRACDNDRTRMMDIVGAVQERFGHVSGEAMEMIAGKVDSHRVEVESVVSFYAFLSDRPKGRVTIRLCNDVVDKLYGVEKVADAFREELGIDFGETTDDGRFSLELVQCIGMCDQPPAALINDKVMTWLSSDAARRIVKTLRENDCDVDKLQHTLGDGNNAHDLVRSMVSNNIREKGPVVFGEFDPGSALDKAVSMTPVEVVRDIKTARLRGRGGAGFPAGMKWEFTRAASGDRKFIVCNADEGEPGTFKDRAILTERPHLLFEGMTIAGYAIGAETGILYLRGEYAYLREFLESVLDERRESGMLGKAAGGKDGFDFEIRIQMGAGAYVCGEETALLSSCEGLRGDPKNRPPFPAQEGYLGLPTAVNNVETLCCAARILDRGPGWFASIGVQGSPGTKLLSVSGDCKSPGVYELPMGISVRELLDRVGAPKARAVQVGGPSGRMIGEQEYERTISYDDLGTGGAVVVFNADRDVLSVVRDYLEFFIEESCGYCTPCRVGNRLLLERLDRIIDGRGEPADLPYLEELGKTVMTASRCGLGQTSPNPVLTTLENFRGEYEKKLGERDDGMQSGFDIRKALGDSEGIAGRKSVHFNE